MAVSRSDAIELANNAISLTSKYNMKIGAIIDGLKTLSSDLSKIKKSIDDYVIADDINSTANGEFTSMTGMISKAIEYANNAKAKSKSNCNAYIANIEKEFNDSCIKTEDRITLNRYN